VNKISQDLNPLISIGIPTFNRPINLKDTLKKIAKYNYKNIEVIVSENDPNCKASYEICKRFESNFQINYFHQEYNRGWMGNFSFVLKKSKGKYFLWHADDDYYDENYFSIAIEDLENNPKSVSFQGKTICIYRDKNKSRTFLQTPIKECNNFELVSEIRKIFCINYMIPALFFQKKKYPNKFSYFIYGLHKSKHLKESWFNLLPFYTNERDLVTSLALKGKIICNDKAVYFRGINNDNTSKKITLNNSIKKILSLKIKKLSQYERYRLKRFNFLNSYNLANEIIKNSFYKNNLALILFLFINISLRNYFLVVYELMTPTYRKIKVLKGKIFKLIKF